MDREATSALALQPIVTTGEINDIVTMLSSMERDLDGTENLIRQGRVKRSTSRHAQARRRRTGTTRTRTAHGARTSAIVDDKSQLRLVESF